MFKVVTCGLGVLLTGDLNLIPTSLLYKWLRMGVADFSHINDKDCKLLSGIYLLNVFIFKYLLINSGQYLMETDRYPVDIHEHNGCGATKLYNDVARP